jgi:molecular chaperone DnaJ
MDIAAAFAELELGPDADAATIKAAWRRLVSRWHPDRYPGSDGTQRIQRINSAYDLLQGLADEDRGDGWQSAGSGESGHATESRDSGGASQGSDAGWTQSTREANDAADSNPHAEPVPTTIRRKLRLRWADVALGLETVLSGHVSLACRGCRGAGWRPIGSACAGCAGRGEIRRASLFGWLGSTLESCEACEGSGAGREPCVACNTSGRQRMSYRQTVRLPAGVRGEQVWSAPLRLDDGRHATLDLQLTVETDPRLRLDDEGAMHATVEVNGWAWVGERWTEVPTPTGAQQMRLRRDHRRYRLAGQGVPPIPGAPRGDLIVHVQPNFPDTSDAESQALIDQLIARTSSGPTHAAGSSAAKDPHKGKPSTRRTTHADSTGPTGRTKDASGTAGASGARRDRRAAAGSRPPARPPA